MAIRNVVPRDLAAKVKDVDAIVRDFVERCAPVEQANLCIFVDARTGARYCEGHLRAETILTLGTIDVPLDPEEQPEYRANREIVEDHVAFNRMKHDATERRTFSNIVAEFSTAYDPDHPLKIIGGQHRYKAIEDALAAGVNELHGLKVYFDLDADQRLDVQLISNTNIATSTDLFDRMHETLAGPELRDWCQECGLLDADADFADKRGRGQALADVKNRDPLNAAALARGRHKTDPENYRGLGYRTDPKERGRFVELLYLQAEKGLRSTRASLISRLRNTTRSKRS